MIQSRPVNGMTQPNPTGLRIPFGLRVSGLLLSVGLCVSAQQAEPPAIAWFFDAAGRDDRAAGKALENIAPRWRDGYTAVIVDLARFMRPARLPGAAPATEGIDNPGRGTGEPDDQRPTTGREPESDLLLSRPRDPSSVARARLIRFLETQTGRRFGDDLGRWRAWMWQLPYEPHPDYAAFKGTLYGQIDPRMREFFRQPGTPRIRLDRIDWGGVPVNGIPPLVYPKIVSASAATYLKDSHVVFGIEVNGQTRAYPKRILAWHELARDRVGDVELTIVYCTLCGTVIPYESVAGGTRRTFGTSGLLYESNKLMFDEETMSLWSTFEGRPVLGPLSNTPLQLTLRSIVTTTWGEWKREHPSTTVLSLDTGHERDYSEGAAYREYFGTDRLMFSTSRSDRRLKNKAEILALRLSDRDSGTDRLVPVAIAADFLARHPVYHVRLAGHDLVVVTSAEGANRVYDAGRERFRVRRPDGGVEDGEGAVWRASEQALEAPDGRRLRRIAAHRAFWFGWYAQYPDTLLVK